MGRDITKLHPELQGKIETLKKLCAAEGLALGIGECFRTVAEQDELYAQGRTKPGSIVTNGKGSSYQSQHQWGIAVDFFRNIKGQEYTSNQFFADVAKIAKGLGLGWGGDWKSFVDRPHLYLPDWGSTTSVLKQRYGTPEAFMATWPTAAGTQPEEVDATEGIVYKTTANLNLRTGPGTNYPAAAVVPQHTALTVTKVEAAKGWHRISYGGRTLYASSQYLREAGRIDLKDYQKAMVADGVLVAANATGAWNTATEQAIRSNVLKAKSPAEKSERAKLIQQAVGLTGKDVDGYFGQGTAKAVKAYQKAKGLTQDGIVGIATTKELLNGIN